VNQLIGKGSFMGNKAVKLPFGSPVSRETSGSRAAGAFFFVAFPLGETYNLFDPTSHRGGHSES
jgi:hypothetical protein